MCRALLPALVLALCLTHAAVAEDVPGPNAAHDVLKKLSDYFAKADTLSATIDMQVSIQMGPQKHEEAGRIEMAVHKPDRFRFSFTQKQNTDTTVCDGRQLTTHMQALKQYTQKPIAATKALEHPAMEVLLQGTLIEPDPYKAITELGQAPVLQPRAKVGAVECDVVRIKTHDATLDLAIQATGDPLPLRMVMHRASRGMTAAGPTPDLTVTMTYTDWQVGQPLHDTLFAFTAPAGAEKVDNFRRPQPSDALTGNPAPDFKLQTLDGKEVTLAQLKGKTVILDFWATWCPPCRKGLPVVKKVADEFADQGVVLYAVNQRETHDKVTGYLKDKKELEGLNVLMDRQAHVAELYLVNGIPQTVIIDAQGVVREVHVGFSPEMEKTLREELTRLTGN